MAGAAAKRLRVSGGTVVAVAKCLESPGWWDSSCREAAEDSRWHSGSRCEAPGEPRWWDSNCREVSGEPRMVGR
jgi:hypothetical protein